MTERINIVGFTGILRRNSYNTTRFVKEQGEEEKNTEDIVKRYDLFGNDPKGLYLIDSELATRIYAPAMLVI